VRQLTTAKLGETVWLRARVHNSRKQGGKLCFLTLRQDLATVQVVVFGPEMAGFAGALSDETVVDVYGKVKAPEEPLKTCTQSDVEVEVEKIFCISRAEPLPLQLADAGRSEVELEKDPSLVRVNQDVRLDNRIIDLRTVANQGILRIQSAVGGLFREYLTREGFVEIHSPKLISAASEGGADVFRVDYFGGDAFLAQSPQLYKQMALMTDLPRVFEVGPVFRSEKSFTHRHMTEFTGLDLEMHFNDHYSECLDVLDGLFNHIFTGLNERFRTEIEAVRGQYPFEDFKWKYPCLKLPFAEAMKILRERGPAYIEKKLAIETNEHERGILQKHLESVREHDEEEDISTEDEKVLGQVIHDLYGEDFYIIDKFPKAVRPFYTMADPADDRWTNSYDLFMRGEEITSGAQRIHDSKMLFDKAASMGVDLTPIQKYVDAFKFGAFPHAGAGIGLERVVMLFMGLNNIRKTSLFPRDPKRLTP
jgi:aspartyl-tRNA synthetase